MSGLRRYWLMLVDVRWYWVLRFVPNLYRGAARGLTCRGHAAPQPGPGRVRSRRLRRLGVLSRRRDRLPKREGGSGRVCDPRDSSQLGVVGINGHPAAQRKDPMGRSVSADLWVHRKVQHPVRNAVRVRPALVHR
jgi:hypothetical protein